MRRQVDPLRSGVPIVDSIGGPTPDFARNFNSLFGNDSDNADTLTGKADKITLVIAGAGLTGGGDLSADRTFDVGAGTGIVVNADDVAIDLTAEAERIRDVMGTALVAGTGITITPDDGADTITIASTITQYTDEMARDALGAALVAGTGVTVTPNDGSDTITIASTITQYTDEMARDALGTALVAGSNVTITVNDAGDTITIAATGGGGSGGSWVPLVNGAEPPAFITDGAGHLILVAGP